MRTLLVLVAAALAAPALAAPDEPVVVLREHLAATDQAREQADMWKRWAEDFSREMRASMGAMFAERTLGSKVVKGASYSADVVTESTQTLGDGNVITHRKTGAVYRDSEGRVRQETVAEGAERTVFINDPVAGTRTVLVPHVRRAITTPLRREGRAGDVSRVTVDGKDIEVAGPGHVVVKRIERTQAGDGTQREEVRVQVIRSGDGDALAPMPPVPPVPPVPAPAPLPPGGPGAKGKAFPVPPVPPVPPMPGVHTMRFESMARLGKGVTTSLGQKQVDGVRAEGKQTTWTIPAGEVGNRDPIRITSETWYSPELQVTVSSRYHDPRTGESVYRLANIRRAEPAAELFRVPEDYQVKSKKG